MNMGPTTVDIFIRLGGDLFRNLLHAKIVSGYDKELPQSQTADKPMAPQGIRGLVKNN